jgi:hypothetical protein
MTEEKMKEAFLSHLEIKLASLREEGLFKDERIISSP